MNIVELQIRQKALELAVATVGSSESPARVIEAAEQFAAYLREEEKPS